MATAAHVSSHDPLEASTLDGSHHLSVIGLGGANVLVQLTPAFDRAATVVLCDVLNGALATDSVVVVDLDRSGPDGVLRLGAPISDDDERFHQPGLGDPEPVQVVGSGLIRIPAVGAAWTIDVVERRLCRAAPLIDHRFVCSGSWTDIHTIWISPSMVSVLTGDDSFITSPRAQDAPLAPSTLQAS